MHWGQRWPQRCLPLLLRPEREIVEDSSDEERLFQTSPAASPVPAWNRGGDCATPCHPFPAVGAAARAKGRGGPQVQPSGKSRATLCPLQTHLPCHPPRRCPRVFSLTCPRPLPKAVGGMVEIPLRSGKKRMRHELLITKDQLPAQGPPSAPCAAASLGPPFCRVSALLSAQPLLGAGPTGRVFPVGREQKGKFPCQNHILGREVEATSAAPAGVTWPPCFPLEALRATIVSDY